MADILKPPTCEVIRAYGINVNYFNTKTLEDENNLSLIIQDEVFD